MNNVHIATCSICKRITRIRYSDTLTDEERQRLEVDCERITAPRRDVTAVSRTDAENMWRTQPGCHCRVIPDGELQVAMGADFGRFAINSLTPDRSYPFPTDAVRALINKYYLDA